MPAAQRRQPVVSLNSVHLPASRSVVSWRSLTVPTASTALSYVVWNSVMKKVRASQGGLAQLLVPVLTAGMGVVFLGEKISAALVVGGALTLAGIYVNGSRVVERRTSQTS